MTLPFLEKFLIPEGDSTHVIFGGDFNRYFNPYLNRFSSAMLRNIPGVHTVNNLTQSRGLTDIWRLQHPTNCDYSFYSRVHTLYTRIDYLLANSPLSLCVSDSKYQFINFGSLPSFNFNEGLPPQTD